MPGQPRRAPKPPTELDQRLRESLRVSYLANAMRGSRDSLRGSVEAYQAIGVDPQEAYEKARQIMKDPSVPPFAELMTTSSGRSDEAGG